MSDAGTINAQPLFRDPDLAAAVDAKLSRTSGDKRTRAEAAIKSVRQSGLVGTFDELVAAYSSAIDRA